jgi:nicotinamide-nucleotide amidase
VDAGLEIGYCAHTGQVDVRLLSRSPEAGRLVDEAEQIVRVQMGEFIYGMEDEDLETVLVRLLTERRQTLALAESCTGGGIASRITNVPGASAVFLAGFVTYSNEAKTRFLGVPDETLARHGAVSEPVARLMAEGARRVSGTDFSIAVTGIAGPGGGTEAKPVGTVFMAVSGEAGTRVEHLVYAYDRIAFKQATGSRALDLLRRVLLGHVSLSERIPV